MQYSFFFFSVLLAAAIWLRECQKLVCLCSSDLVCKEHQMGSSEVEAAVTFGGLTIILGVLIQS